MRVRRGPVHVVVFLSCLWLNLALGPTAPQGGDTVPNRYLAWSLAHGYGFRMEPFAPLWGGSLDKVPYYVTRTWRGELISTFGPAVPLLAAPFYLADRLLHDDDGDFFRIPEVARTTAGVASALAATLVFAACWELFGALPAFLALLALALGSAVLTVASRGLWQHTFALPFISLGLWSIVRWSQTGRQGHATLAGFSLALATCCRPQMGLFLLASWLAVSSRDLRSGLYLAGAALAPLIPLFAYNTWYLDSPFAFAQTIRSADVALYKTGSSSVWSGNPMVGAAGLLFSPSRGLFFFSPALGLGAVGMLALFGSRAPLVMDRGRLRVSRWFAAAAVAVLALQASWFDWWGGYTVTYRPITELTVPFAAGLAFLLRLGSTTRRHWAYVLVVPSLLWSSFVAIQTVRNPGVVVWNEEVQVDRHPERLFDLKGSPLVRILEPLPGDRHTPLDAMPVDVRIE